MEIGYVIVFRNEGLNLKGVVEDLKELGCTITGISEDYCTIGGEPCTSVFLMSDIGVFIKVKLEYNLLEDKEHKYHYWPMEFSAEIDEIFTDKYRKKIFG